jgi:hypothetical protein
MCRANVTRNQYQTDKDNDTNNPKEINGDKREHTRICLLSKVQIDLLWGREQLSVPVESNK